MSCVTPRRDCGQCCVRGAAYDRVGAEKLTRYTDKRTSAWLKLKKDYVVGLGDSLDLVPVGAWHGNGRKAQWWSPILLAVWDPDAQKLVAVCKCMSGKSARPVWTSMRQWILRGFNRFL